MVVSQVAGQVNDEFKKIENQTFSALSDIDNKLNLSSRKSFEMSGCIDYYAFKDNA